MLDNKSIVKPEIYFLEDLMKLIDDGSLRIPKFQRPYVWSPVDILELFESIMKGYPIGSLFFWETSEEFKTSENFGLHTIPKNANKNITYVIDGQQRLVTLYNVLRFKFNRDADNWHFSVYYDLMEKELKNFDYKKNITNEKDLEKHYYFPLNSVERTFDFLNECKKISAKFPKDTQMLIEEAERLVASIKDYKISVTKFIGGSLEDAVDIFSRLNRQGKRITTLELFEALTYKEGEKEFDLSVNIDSIIKELAEYNFQSIPRNSMLRIILLALDKSYTYKSWYKVARNFQNEISKVINDVAENAILAAEFFREKVKIPVFELVPYILQFVYLCEFYRNCASPSKTQIETLKKWFWITSYTGWFPMNRGKYNQLLNEIRSLAKNEITKFTVIDETEAASAFPRSLTFQAARVKVFILFLASLEPRDLETGKKINTSELFIQSKENALSTILAKNLSPSNYLLIGPHSSKSILTKLKNLITGTQKTKIKEILESHCLTEENIKDLLAGRNEKFLKAREIKLKDLEIEFIKSKGIEQPDVKVSKDYLPEIIEEE